jgi:hypothetical protein
MDPVLGSQHCANDMKGDELPTDYEFDQRPFKIEEETFIVMRLI